MAEIADPDQNEAIQARQGESGTGPGSLKRIGIDFEVVVELDPTSQETRDVWEEVTSAAMASADAIFGAISTSSYNFAQLMVGQNVESRDLFDWAPGWYARWIRFQPNHLFKMNKAQFKGFRSGEPLIGQKTDSLDLTVGSLLLGPWKTSLAGVVFKVEPSLGLRIPISTGKTIPILAGSEIGSISLVGLSFEAGSENARLTLRLQIASLVLSFVGLPFWQAIGTNISKPVIETITLHSRVKDNLSRVPLKFREFKYSESDLKKYGEDCFNYNEHGISDYEKRQRMGLVELAAAVDSNTHLAIDGRIGPDATKVLDATAKKHGLKEFDINNRVARGVLYKALIPDGHLW